LHYRVSFFAWACQRMPTHDLFKRLVIQPAHELVSEPVAKYPLVGFEELLPQRLWCLVQLGALGIEEASFVQEPVEPLQLGASIAHRVEVAFEVFTLKGFGQYVGVAR